MKNNKGMTLVELVVALAVTSIILASVGSILFLSFKVFNDVNQSNEDKLIGDTVYEFIVDKVIMASSLEIVNEQNIVVDETDTITINTDGRFIYNGVDLYGDVYYNNKKLTLSISQYGTDTVSVNVFVWEDNKITYTAGSVVKMLNYTFS